MSEQANDQLVNFHYGRSQLASAILSALKDAGKDLSKLKTEDLAPIDHFHTRGKPATLELAERAGIKGNSKVLDVGGGIGGAARFLAKEFGCRVTVLDLTKEYCAAGEMLTEKTGLEDLVSFRCGSALTMPFSEQSFDLVWTQHSSMNIADKPKLYREIYRVLRPAGKLAMHEITAGENAPLHFPVPWAREPALSFLEKPEKLRQIIKNAGFRETIWIDETNSAIDWFRQMPPKKPSALGLHLLLGEEFGAMFKNQVRNLNENRVAVIQAVFVR